MNMRDIDRFSESRMSAKYRAGFLQGLPSHIRVMVTITSANPSRALQGYRGPSDLRDNSSGDSETLNPLYGVQEIRYTYALTKAIHFLPIAGTLVFGAVRLIDHAIGHSNWTSAFFDETSGDILSYSQAQEYKSKNQNAESNCSDGAKYESQNDFEKAIEAYQTACSACTKGYKNEALFLSCKQRVQNKWASFLCEQGNQLIYLEKNYNKAFEMYKKAHEVCTNDCESKDLYKRGQDLAERNMKNAESNARAKDLYDRGHLKNYEGAIIFFNDALSQTVDDELQTKIKKSKFDTLNEWATDLEGSGDIENAIRKFKDAVNSATDKIDRYRSELGLLKAEAKSLYVKALTLWNEAWKDENNEEEDAATVKFRKSSSLFLEAFNKDPANLDYQRLSNECTLKIEGNAFFNDGLKLREEANKLHHQQKYNEALSKNREALSKNREALQKFQEGYVLGSDERFKNCIDIVKEVSDVIATIIPSIGLKSSTSVDESDSEKYCIQTIGMISPRSK